MDRKRLAFVAEGLMSADESPFDNVLRTDDVNRAKNMLSTPFFLQSYPPRITLEQYVAGRRGDDGFCETLVLLISYKIYAITCVFLQHVVRHFSLPKVMAVLDAVNEDHVSNMKSQGTVLHLACQKGYLEVMKRLVQLGFEVEHKDSKNQSPIFYLIQGEDPVVLKAIIPGYEGMASLPVLPDVVCDAVTELETGHGLPEYDRNRIIFVDLQHNYTFSEATWNFMVKEMNVELNNVDDFGDTPLTLAIKLHRTEVIQKLLTNNRVKVELRSHGKQPFHLYCEEGCINRAIFHQFMFRQSLVKPKGLADVDYEKRTVVHCLLNNQACIETPSFLVPFLQKLITYEPGLLSMQDAAGDTPLMTAITLGYPIDLLQHLIPGSSAGVNLVNRQGFNALALALIRFEGEYQSGNTVPTSANAAAAADHCHEKEKNYRDKWRWDNQLYHPQHPIQQQQQQQQQHQQQHSSQSSYHQRRNSLANSRCPHSTPRNGNGSNSNSSHTGGKIVRKSSVSPSFAQVLTDEMSVEMLSVNAAEAELHLLIHALTKQQGKLEPVPGSWTKKYPSIKSRDSILSFVVHNKKITYRTLKLLLQKGLITSFTGNELLCCTVEFRLDLLHELVMYASSSKNKQMCQVIKREKDLAINIVDHVYTFRHIYAAVKMSQQSFLQSANDPSLTHRDVSYAGKNVPAIKSMIFDSIPETSRLVAQQNLSRLKDLISRLFDDFDHDLNHVIKTIDPHTKREIESFTLIHALIQSSSWIEMPDVVSYLLRERGPELNINVLLPGRGTPINYAIRLGQFDIADMILDLNPDVSDLDLAMPVVPLKRNFSHTMRRLMERGVRIPKDFALQNIKSGIDDHKLEIECLTFMQEVSKSRKVAA